MKTTKFEGKNFDLSIRAIEDSDTINTGDMKASSGCCCSCTCSCSCG